MRCLPRKPFTDRLVVCGELLVGGSESCVGGGEHGDRIGELLKDRLFVGDGSGKVVEVIFQLLLVVGRRSISWGDIVVSEVHPGALG